ncbi:MAG: CDP-2,3-bis-(O-geranylgeranyl)-sn-glycerol synthase [Candidatus Thorarchaeota archaeon]|jgi:CDP-2,3-bis-(O-geranylgeranyl)-sn-glycerol synthase
MYEAIALVELAVWLGLPAWIANSTPVIFGGGRPIDRGRVFRDGRRIFGDGKTVRGLIVGIILGTLTGLVQGIVAPYLQPILAQFVTVTSDMQYVLYMNLPAAFLLSVGALLGDLIGSFLKRRVNITSGNPAPFLDQLGFIILALVLAVPFLQPSPEYPIILILITLGIHWISNALGYLLGLKKNPW